MPGAARWCRGVEDDRGYAAERDDQQGGPQHDPKRPQQPPAGRTIPGAAGLRISAELLKQDFTAQKETTRPSSQAHYP
jgi:hypothetical protein